MHHGEGMEARACGALEHETVPPSCGSLVSSAWRPDRTPRWAQHDNLYGWQARARENWAFVSGERSLPPSQLLGLEHDASCKPGISSMHRIRSHGRSFRRRRGRHLDCFAPSEGVVHDALVSHRAFAFANVTRLPLPVAHWLGPTRTTVFG